jgi:hypothetical protein
VERKLPHPETRFLDHNHGPAHEWLRQSGQSHLEPYDHVPGTRIVKAKQDNTCTGPGGKCGDLAEIQIEGQDDTAIGCSLGKNGLIRQAMQALVAEMDHVVPRRPEPVNDSKAHTHIREKPQSSSS